MQTQRDRRKRWEVEVLRAARWSLPKCWIEKPLRHTECTGNRYRYVIRLCWSITKEEIFLLNRAFVARTVLFPMPSNKQ